jgi:hypothetical protein
MHIGLGEQITCPAALPSGTSAYRLMSGDPSGLVGVVGHTLARSALVGTGMAIAGEREHIVRNAVAGALGIEAFVLVWAAWKVHKDASTPASGTTQGAFFP